VGYLVQSKPTFVTPSTLVFSNRRIYYRMLDKFILPYCFELECEVGVEVGRVGVERDVERGGIYILEVRLLAAMMKLSA
jgi:hypothetical protein